MNFNYFYSLVTKQCDSPEVFSANNFLRKPSYKFCFKEPTKTYRVDNNKRRRLNPSNEEEYYIPAYGYSSD